VEVFGEEWSFQYYEDCWDDSSVSGLVRCRPKAMDQYEYQESVNLGPTPLTQDEVDKMLRHLSPEWPACSYHLTRNNCLTFAERLVEKLQVPKPFPSRLRSVLDTSRSYSAVDTTVDYAWSWMRWWMLRKHRQESVVEDPRHQPQSWFGERLLEILTSCGMLCDKRPDRSSLNLVSATDFMASDDELPPSGGRSWSAGVM